MYKNTYVFIFDRRDPPASVRSPARPPRAIASIDRLLRRTARGTPTADGPNHHHRNENDERSSSDEKMLTDGCGDGGWRTKDNKDMNIAPVKSQKQGCCPPQSAISSKTECQTVHHGVKFLVPGGGSVLFVESGSHLDGRRNPSSVQELVHYLSS